MSYCAALLRQVAVLDVLVEPPFYLRDPDGRSDKSLRDVEAEEERAAAAGKSKNGRSANGGGNDNGHNDDDGEEEEATDPTDAPMGLRMKLPLKYLRGLLNKLEREEKLIKSELLDSARYYYIDYDFFYSVSLSVSTLCSRVQGERARIFMCLFHLSILLFSVTLPKL